jgi:hypothetical protein
VCERERERERASARRYHQAREHPCISGSFFRFLSEVVNRQQAIISSHAARREAAYFARNVHVCIQACMAARSAGGVIDRLRPTSSSATTCMGPRRESVHGDGGFVLPTSETPTQCPCLSQRTQRARMHLLPCNFDLFHAQQLIAESSSKQAPAVFAAAPIYIMLHTLVENGPLAWTL